MRLGKKSFGRDVVIVADPSGDRPRARRGPGESSRGDPRRAGRGRVPRRKGTSGPRRRRPPPRGHPGRPDGRPPGRGARVHRRRPSRRRAWADRGRGGRRSRPIPSTRRRPKALDASTGEATTRTPGDRRPSRRLRVSDRPFECRPSILSKKPDESYNPMNEFVLVNCKS